MANKRMARRSTPRNGKGCMMIALAKAMTGIAVAAMRFLWRLDLGKTSVTERWFGESWYSTQLQVGDLVTFEHSAFKVRFQGRIVKSARTPLWWVDYSWPDGRCGSTLCSSQELTRFCRVAQYNTKRR